MGKRVVGFHVEAFALLILSGRYIGFLPEHYASIWEEKGEVRKLHPKRYEALVNFSIMTAQGRSPTAAQTAFLALLRKAAATSHSGRGSVASAVA
jgi:DNA-binding transcriptional LysR family regulator